MTSLNLNYIPTGFEKTEEYISNDFYIENYKNIDKSFTVEKCTLTANIGFDTEKYDSENIYNDTKLERQLFKELKDKNNTLRKIEEERSIIKYFAEISNSKYDFIINREGKEHLNYTLIRYVFYEEVIVYI